MVLLRMPSAGSPHRGESAAPCEGPAAALRGLLRRRKNAQVQELRGHSPRQETAGRVDEALTGRFQPLRYFSTAFLSHTSPFPGRCGTTAKPSTISSGSAKILSAQSIYSRKWQGGVPANRKPAHSGYKRRG